MKGFRRTKYTGAVCSAGFQGYSVAAWANISFAVQKDLPERGLCQCQSGSATPLYHYMNQYFEIEMKVATLKHDLQIHPQNPTILAFHRHFPRCRVSAPSDALLLQQIGAAAVPDSGRVPKVCCRCACASPKSGKDTMTWDQKWLRHSWNPKTTTFQYLILHQFLYFECYINLYGPVPVLAKQCSGWWQKNTGTLGFSCQDENIIYQMYVLYMSTDCNITTQCWFTLLLVGLNKNIVFESLLRPYFVASVVVEAWQNPPFLQFLQDLKQVRSSGHLSAALYSAAWADSVSSCRGQSLDIDVTSGFW